MTIDTARCETCGGARQIMPDGSPVEDFNADTAALASACPDCTEPAPSHVQSMVLRSMADSHSNDEVRSMARELLSARSRIAELSRQLEQAEAVRSDEAFGGALSDELYKKRIEELEAGVRNALQQLDDDLDYAPLRADIRALLPKEST